MEQTILIPNVWQRTGVRSFHTELPVQPLVPRVWMRGLVMKLEWRAPRSYWGLTAKAKDAYFTSDPGTLQELVEYGYAATLDNNPQANRRFGVVTPDDVLHLEIWIDTDDPGFLADARGDNGVRVEVGYSITSLERTDAPQDESDSGKWFFQLQPATPMLRYGGVIAIDLGDATSVLASLDVGTSTPITTVLPTALQVARYRPASSPDQMDHVEVRIGDGLDEADVIPQPERPLVLGIKRRLRSRTRPLHLWINGERHAVDNHLPAEWYVTAMLREFHHETCQVPRQIAVTYPPTYSRAEVERLREAVVQGWRRSLGVRGRDYDRGRLTDLPALMIDETTAAATYFAFRQILEAPGGMAGLRYLYPDGVRLLLWDCGAQACNVALIHLRADLNARDGAPIRLRLDLKARASLRDLGGDAVTLAVYRVLKALLATQVDSTGRARLAGLPPANLAQYLDQNKRTIDDLVPTTFAEEPDAAGNYPLRRLLGRLLWDSARTIAAHLSQTHSSKIEQPDSIRKLLARLNRPITDPKPILLSRSSVDPLLRSSFVAGINRVNRLLEPLQSEHGIDVVGLIGAGSRYPLLAELMQQHLEIHFLSERLLPLKEDRKTCVAEGALRALRMRTEYTGIALEESQSPADFLPFDVAYRDLAHGAHHVLYKEGEAYDRPPARLDLASLGASSGTLRQLQLFRRGPGEEDFVPYLLFRFPKPIRGPIELHFASDGPHRGALIATDSDNGETVVGDELDNGEPPFRS